MAPNSTSPSTSASPRPWMCWRSILPMTRSSVPHTETIIVTCYAILMVMGLCCNLLVCSVILANTKIRSSRNLLVINLNISDIILCVFCMPFTLLVIIRRSWFLGAFLCKLVPFVQASTIW
ncbi:neuropeptide Y receptor type 1 [Caerostris extrusa]|uniref:Neuropeptide Y receptor type 1 n=1 Tax=Caerostris extrusa TaxID=172846 RepID=A0AAV4WY98_CAEEX|nr:neuropeptide Y receptor type 1 [Caerostris extrusa]